ncbi:MAG: DEAD/DEAH box helicase [Firmicutes bacterium]|jgi:SNF2 family DNA or RNA helicase|nr:DEAD/DEAH box helicase [Bacillota bacterium]
MPKDTATISDSQLTPNKDIPLRPFPITVPLLTFSYDSLFRPPPEEEFTEEEPVTESFGVSFSRSSANSLFEQMHNNTWAPIAWYSLAVMAERLSLQTPDDELLVLSNLRERWHRVGAITYPHQVETVKRVMKEMGGRAILADEVGLGKTIEACMILKEYMLRNMVSRCLILTPASLRWQWYSELKEKFAVVAAIQRSEYDWERCPVLIASLDTAKRAPHSEIIQNVNYDLVIVDEAHKLRNPSSMNWRLVNSLHKKYLLLLTATPVQNDLRELYTLISLLKPGQLGTYRQFQQKFMIDKRMPRNPQALRRLLSQVMIRNRRQDTPVEFTKRHVQSIAVDFSPAEKEAYTALSQALRSSAHTWGAMTGSALSLLILQREFCSSPVAAAVTLRKLLTKSEHPDHIRIYQDLLGMIEACYVCSKADKLLRIIGEIEDKVIVFTEYRATQQYLRALLETAGYATLGFDGSLSSSRKEWVRELFRKAGHVLVSTESGGEGLNFQFACHVVNYDLPWNPMRLEQRIGRVHRLGQTRDVHIYNLAVNGTVEEYILFLLYEKINMFNLVIGELDIILAQLGQGGGIERRLYQIASDAIENPDLWQERLDELVDEFTQATEDVRKRRERIDSWLTW